MLAAACGGGPPPSTVSSPVVVSATRESLRITLTLEGPPRTGAVSWASMTVENVGERAIRWAGGGCGDPGGIFIDLQQLFPAGRTDWPEPLAHFKQEVLGPRGGLLNLGYENASRWATIIACPAVLKIETLPAGATLAMRAGWDGTYEGSPVPTGPVTVEAMFPVIGIEGVVADDAFDSHPVGVSTPTQVVGEAGAAVLAPGLLIDAALADPQFAAWVADGPVARWINPDLAHIGDTWQVGLFKFGADGASEVYRGVVLDASGRVIEHRSG